MIDPPDTPGNAPMVAVEPWNARLVSSSAYIPPSIECWLRISKTPLIHEVPSHADVLNHPPVQQWGGLVPATAVDRDIEDDRGRDVAILCGVDKLA